MQSAYCSATATPRSGLAHEGIEPIAMDAGEKAPDEAGERLGIGGSLNEAVRKSGHFVSPV